MRNLSNIDKSGFHHGEYVGYSTSGRWRIVPNPVRGKNGRKRTKGWRATKSYHTLIRATLAQLNEALEGFGA